MEGNILITGGTGTLGNAIVRQALAENWEGNLTIFSRSEHKQARMKAKYPFLRYVLGDIRDEDRVEAAIAGHDVVIHAAAMKRLPECDAQPNECYQTNVQGSYNVLRGCQRHSVQRLIAISTDKACAATTAYGASKLMMEKLLASGKGWTDGLTNCTLVRYGNVVASAGSVIPIWREQARSGQKLTVTNKDMTRFWMAPSHAVALIQLASDLAHGEIIVPKMKALSIGQMAQYISPESDITEIGLRFPEKHHEDLVHKDERAVELATFFVLGHGPTGTAYTSDKAPILSSGEFYALLEEAETYE